MEILAPCGSPEHVKAAVYAGADAIYLGGHGFSARRNAPNFSMAELRETARFCHGFGVKLYVTVNILTKDGEWDALRAYLVELADAAPDALIVQDIGVARLCRRLLPDLPLHASTQMSIHSAAGVRFCEELGFTRVVIARECDQKTLSALIASTSIGIEVFVHGALCVSVSGQCGLSAVIGGRSGNRGLCAQPCRLDFTDGARRYALSLKDLSLVRQAPLLAQMGVAALKIEGRMKRPEYVAAAVHAVRASLSGEEVPLDDLRAVFSRDGFTTGYFDNRHTGMNGIRRPEDQKESARILPRLREHMRVPAGRIPVTLDLTMRNRQPCCLTLSEGPDTVRAVGDIPSSAVKRATTEEEAVKLLSRLGGTPFTAAGIRTHIEPGLFLSAAQINALRRDACDQLLARRIRRLTPHYAVSQPDPPSAPVKPAAQSPPSPPLRIHCHTLAQAQAAQSPPSPPLRIHCHTLAQAQAAAGQAHQLVLSLAHIQTALDKPDLFPPETLLAAPDRYITDERRLARQLSALRKKGAKRLLCQNPAHVMLGNDLGYTLHGGLGLNVFNRQTVTFWADRGLLDLTASMELRLPECLTLFGHPPVGLAVYGRLPLMLLRRCPFDRNCEAGSSCPGVLSDRTNRRFPLSCYGDWRELLNADILWMADRLSELCGAGFISLLLYEEAPDDVISLIHAYTKGGQPPANYTRGLLTRGVE